MEIPQAVADAVIALRERLGYSSQQNFAVFLEVSHQAVAGWEQARRNVQPLQLKQFSALAAEHGWRDLAAIFEARLAEKRRSKPQIAPPVRPEPQLSPTSREFNDVVAVEALKVVLRDAPKPFRDSLVAKAVEGAEKYGKFNPAAATSEPLSPGRRPMNVYTLEHWKKGLEAHAFSTVEIPVVDHPAAAGPPRYITEEMIREVLQVPASWLKKGRGPGDYRLIPVVGDSMMPVLHEGDLACVDAASEPRKGQVVAAFHDGGNVFKRLAGKQADGRVVLNSDNTAYQPIFLGEDDRLIGPVAWAIARKIK